MENSTGDKLAFDYKFCQVNNLDKTGYHLRNRSVLTLWPVGIHFMNLSLAPFSRQVL